MRGTTLAAVVVVGLLLGGLAGCGDDPKPKFSESADPSPVAVSSSPTISNAPTPVRPPEMPELAKRHTVAGAKAFVRHVWDVAHYAESTLDSAPFKDLMAGSCAGCQGALDFLAKVRNKSGSIKGGETSIAVRKVDKLPVKGLTLMAVTFDVTTTRQVITYKSGPSDIYVGGRARDRFTLFPVNDGWTVVKWEGL